VSTSEKSIWPGVPQGGWKRVLLKLSGEAFAGEGKLGVDPDVVNDIARQISRSC
jgi:uridylate kinase